MVSGEKEVSVRLKDHYIIFKVGGPRGLLFWVHKVRFYLRILELNNDVFL